jgi:hypothetical protein
LSSAATAGAGRRVSVEGRAATEKCQESAKVPGKLGRAAAENRRELWERMKEGRQKEGRASNRTASEHCSVSGSALLALCGNHHDHASD